MKTTIHSLGFLALGALSLAAPVAACSSSSSTPLPSHDAGADHTTTSSSSGSSSGSTSSSSSGGSGSSSSGSGSGSSSGSEAGGNPPPPTLGTQIDRMGRPAINTALDHTFDPNTSTKNAAKDSYNADNSPSHWSTYVPEFEKNLAIYDGLDTTCGNQAGFGAAGNPGYATLATVLSNDVLWLNTGSTTCAQYLAVEFAALGVNNTDCGGRTLTENTIDLTFNAVAGTLTPATLPGNPGPVTNGITAPASPPSATFPYMASPH